MKRLIVFAALFLCAGLASAQNSYTYPTKPTSEGTGVSTCTLTRIQSDTVLASGRGSVSYIWTWTSSSGGTVTLVMPTTLLIDGTITGFETDPGSPAPTDNYDITLKDPYGFDLLMGGGTDRDTSTTEFFTPYSTDSGPHAYSLLTFVDTLTFQVTHAGSGKQGVAILRLTK